MIASARFAPPPAHPPATPASSSCHNAKPRRWRSCNPVLSAVSDSVHVPSVEASARLLLPLPRAGVAPASISKRELTRKTWSTNKGSVTDVIAGSKKTDDVSALLDRPPCSSSCPRNVSRQPTKSAATGSISTAPPVEDAVVVAAVEETSTESDTKAWCAKRFSHCLLLPPPVPAPAMPAAAAAAAAVAPAAAFGGELHIFSSSADQRSATSSPRPWPRIEVQSTATSGYAGSRTLSCGAMCLYLVWRKRPYSLLTAAAELSFSVAVSLLPDSSLLRLNDTKTSSTSNAKCGSKVCRKWASTYANRTRPAHCASCPSAAAGTLAGVPLATTLLG